MFWLFFFTLYKNLTFGTICAILIIVIMEEYKYIMYIIIILLTIIFISIITGLVIYNNKKIEKERKEYYNKIQQEAEENFINNKQKELENNLLIEFAKRREVAKLEHQEWMRNLEWERAQVKHDTQTTEEQLKQLKLRKEEQTKAIAETISDKKKIVETEVEAFRTTEMQKARTAVESETEAVRAWASNSLNLYFNEMAEAAKITKEQLEQTKLVLEEYRQKQQSVNEAILRQRKIEEQQDFYRVVLSEFTIEDIKILQEVKQKLHTSDSLNKLIYDVYVSKQVQEMVKRVLQGGAPSGIYKITRLKTGEIYIGKSTNVKDRWQQHCKTVFGAGTIAHSILHTTMQKDGLQNFTFELIEEVPKDKLTEREKYWINFYGSKEYGLNERNG